MNSNQAEDLEAISFTGVRGVEGIKEATVTLGDTGSEDRSGEWTEMLRRSDGQDQVGRSCTMISWKSWHAREAVSPEADSRCRSARGQRRQEWKDCTRLTNGTDQAFQ